MNINNLIEKLLARLARIRTLKYATNALRKVLQAEGIEYVPFGVGNKKTKLPGFYRKVGNTCPPDCPYLGKGCYSEGGPACLQQVRAVDDPDATVASFIVCTILANKYCGDWPSRMFVSGDVCRFGKVDRELVNKLKVAAVALRKHLGMDVVGYGYTHTHDPALLAELEEVGIVILQSDEIGAGCAIVHPHGDIGSLPKADGFRYIKCPSQTTDHVKCANCPICKDARRKGSCVVFDPHGPGKKNLELQYT
ncbi:MAG: hypothetical protein GF334_10265 [Candidatus Altiarchaeales archaeon]|nr:hypothetical protein [Candidatus Altiarchaeales archaeon]